MSIHPFTEPPIKPPHQEEEGGQERGLTHEEMQKKFRDPSFLPSYGALSQLFKKFNPIKYWDHDRFHDPEWKKWMDLAGDEENPIYEILTKEYIHAFGTYLAQRVLELGGTEENPTVILEVGAGNGRLTHFLLEKMNELVPGKVNIVASDSGKWKVSPAFPVENIPHDEALAKYKPNIVIFSWMPSGYDCTSDFRATKSVDEYILIGEAHGGACGDPWLTWGENFAVSKEDQERLKNQPTPYEADGFEMVFHNDLGDLQLSESSIVAGTTKTCTVSFKRRFQEFSATSLLNTS